MTRGLPDQEARTVTVVRVEDVREETKSSGDLGTDANPSARSAATDETSPQRGTGHPRLPAPLQYRDPDRYEVVAEHGRGGLGRVMRARDRELGRWLAIKELLKPSHSSEFRFFREAIITARLEHPNIVPVHEAGRWPDGTPFYAMKLVAGRPLDKLIQEAASFEERSSLVPHVIAVADAVAYAHSKGIIHRDLKPSNVIVGNFGETVVIDWGLAKSVHEADEDTADSAGGSSSPASGLTGHGDVLGTIAYMSPEQARGDDVDFRTDVYALGALLYHVLTGMAPYANSGDGNVLARLLAGPPSDIADGRIIPADLASIVRTAMARDCTSRYQSAADFASDLRLWLSGQRVIAHRYPALALARRWAARRAGALGVAAAALVIITVGGALSLRRITLERDQASRAEQVATNRAEEVLLEQAEALLRSDPSRALSIAESLRSSNEYHNRAALVAARALAKGTTLQSFQVQHAVVHQLFWQPNQSLLLYGNKDILEAVSIPSKAIATVAPLARFGAVGVDRDTGALVYNHSNGSLVVSKAGAVQRTIDNVDGSASQLELSSRTNTVAASFANGAVRVWSAADDTPPWQVGDPTGIRRDIRLSPTGGLLAICGQDGNLAVFRVRDRTKVLASTCDGLEKHPLLFIANETAIVTGHRDGQLVRHPLNGNRSSALMARLDGPVRYLADLDGASIVAVSVAGDIVKVDNALTRVAWRSHTAARVSVARSSSVVGLTAIGLVDGSIVILDAAGERFPLLLGHATAVDELAISADGRHLASSASADVRVWRLERTVPRSIPLSPVTLFSAKFSPDSQYVATNGRDGFVTICKTSTLTCTSTRAHDSYAIGLAWTPDGNKVVTGGWDGRLHVLDHRSGEAFATKVPEELPISLEGFIRDGEHVLTFTGGTTLEIRTLRTGAATNESFPEQTGAVAISETGGKVAILDRSRNVQVFSAHPSLTLSQTLDCRDDASALAISHTSRYVACATEQGYIRIFDREKASTWSEWRISAPYTAARLASFSPNEGHLAISFSDGRVVHVALATLSAYEHRPFARPAMDLVVSNNYVSAATSAGQAWSARTAVESQICMAELSEGNVIDLDVSPDDATLVATSDSGRLHTLPRSQCEWTSYSPILLPENHTP
jgi:WD40 repeat protein